MACEFATMKVWRAFQLAAGKIRKFRVLHYLPAVKARHQHELFYNSVGHFHFLCQSHHLPRGCSVLYLPVAFVIVMAARFHVLQIYKIFSQITGPPTEFSTTFMG
jgi:hypothetical protein